MNAGIRALPAFLVAVFSVSSQAQVEVKEVSTRPGVTVKFLYAKAANPVASAILFQGGPGTIGIFPNGTTRNSGFLATAAKRFTDNGVSVAIPDVPSDRGNLNDFRESPEHAQDNAALIDYLRQQAKVPVWAIGTSNGSLSAAASSTFLKDKGPDGLVLTSTVTRKLRSALHVVTAAPLAEVKVPVLLVHHKQDNCDATPYGDMPELTARFTAAKKVELISEEGGIEQGNPCYTGHHQFLGIEAAVTKDIADWIKHYQAGPPK